MIVANEGITSCWGASMLVSLVGTFPAVAVVAVAGSAVADGPAEAQTTVAGLGGLWGLHLRPQNDRSHKVPKLLPQETELHDSSDS